MTTPDFENITRLQMSPELWRAKFGERPFASEDRGRYVALTGIFACEGANDDGVESHIDLANEPTQTVNLRRSVVVDGIAPLHEEQERIMSV